MRNLRLEEKNMNKKLLSLALALALALSLTACGSSSSSDTATTTDTSTDTTTTTDTATADTTTEPVVLNVAASPTPHAEILEQCVPILAEQGIDLEIHEYGDYVIPNTAVEEGDEDANYFQHVPYLDNFNAENGTHLVSVAGIHIEPMGIYAGKTASLDELADGATVAVPNDVTNEARALLLLEAQGLITLSDDAGLEATPNDIVDNPKNLTFTELEAAMVPNVVSEVDIAVINSNYAMQAGFNPVTDALAIEDADSPYVNVLVVKEGNENDPAILALIDALQSDTVRDFINETYDGAVVPVF
jgi:D-methionine transport system substrate-binding protein